MSKNMNQPNPLDGEELAQISGGVSPLVQNGLIEGGLGRDTVRHTNSKIIIANDGNDLIRQTTTNFDILTGGDGCDR